MFRAISLSELLVCVFYSYTPLTVVYGFVVCFVCLLVFFVSDTHYSTFLRSNSTLLVLNSNRNMLSIY